MVTIGRSEAEPYTDILMKISAKYGVLSVLGNHDFMIYVSIPFDDREKAVSDLVNYQEEVLGWNLQETTMLPVYMKTVNRLCT